jgi:hypothetical protein
LEVTCYGLANHNDRTRTTLRANLVGTHSQAAQAVFPLNRGLGKLCARHGIPVPPRGYWARVARGHKPKRPPLQLLKDGQPRIIRIERHLKSALGEEPPSQPAPAEVQYERELAHRITVPEDLRVAHPLLRQARRLLHEAKPDDRGMLRPPSGCLHIRVSRAASASHLFQLQHRGPLSRILSQLLEKLAHSNNLTVSSGSRSRLFCLAVRLAGGWRAENKCGIKRGIKATVDTISILFAYIYKNIVAERVGFEPTCPCGQDAFEAPPLRPLRYLSAEEISAANTPW